MKRAFANRKLLLSYLMFALCYGSIWLVLLMPDTVARLVGTVH